MFKRIRYDILYKNGKSEMIYEGKEDSQLAKVVEVAFQQDMSGVLVFHPEDHITKVIRVSDISSFMVTKLTV